MMSKLDIITKHKDFVYDRVKARGLDWLKSAEFENIVQREHTREFGLFAKAFTNKKLYDPQLTLVNRLAEL